PETNPLSCTPPNRESSTTIGGACGHLRLNCGRSLRGVEAPVVLEELDRRVVADAARDGGRRILADEADDASLARREVVAEPLKQRRQLERARLGVVPETAIATLQVGAHLLVEL